MLKTLIPSILLALIRASTGLDDSSKEQNRQLFEISENDRQPFEISEEQNRQPFEISEEQNRQSFEIGEEQNRQSFEIGEKQNRQLFEINENGRLYVSGTVFSFDDSEMDEALKSLQPEIKRTTFFYQKITKIPINLADLAPHVKEIDLLNCGELKAIGSGELKPLEELEKIQIYQANIEMIDSSSFKGIEKLTELEIYENKASMTIKNNAFMDLWKLKALTLDYCGIETIGRDTFVGLDNLTFLSLRENKIKKIDADAFSELYNLRILFLYGNPIEEFDPDAFINVPNLSQLYIDYDTLKKIGIEAFDRILPKLTILRVYRNQVTEGEEDITEKLRERRPGISIHIDEMTFNK